MTITSQDVQKYIRMVLQWGATWLVSHGMISDNGQWTEVIIGLAVGIGSFAWTIYGGRIQAKIDDFMKVVNISPEAMAILEKSVQVAILNAATKVPGTQKVVNPSMASDPTTANKVTTS